MNESDTDTGKHSANTRAKNLFLFIASILFALILLEFVGGSILLKLTNNPPRTQTLINFTAEPNSTVDNVVINDHGFTGDSFAKQKSPNTLRVLTLGGSVLFNDNITQELKERLQEISPHKLEVEGAALRSHSTASSVIKFKQFFKDYNVDYVLIYHGINDLWMNHVAKEDFKNDYSHYLSAYKRNAFLDNSVIARVTYSATHNQSPPYVHNGADFATEKTFADNLNALLSSIQDAEATPVLMTFAWHIPEGYSKENFESGTAGYNSDTGNEYKDLWPVEIWGEVNYVKEGLQRHNAVIRQIAHSRQIPLIDQEQLLSSNIDNFGDVCHLNSQGRKQFILNVSHYLQQHFPEFKTLQN